MQARRQPVRHAATGSSVCWFERGGRRHSESVDPDWRCSSRREPSRRVSAGLSPADVPARVASRRSPRERRTDGGVQRGVDWHTATGVRHSPGKPAIRIDRSCRGRRVFGLVERRTGRRPRLPSELGRMYRDTGPRPDDRRHSTRAGEGRSRRRLGARRREPGRRLVRRRPIPARVSGRQGVIRAAWLDHLRAFVAERRSHRVPGSSAPG